MTPNYQEQHTGDSDATTAPNQELFDLLEQMTGKVFLQSELQDVIECVRKYYPAVPADKEVEDALMDYLGIVNGSDNVKHDCHVFMKKHSSTILRLLQTAAQSKAVVWRDISTAPRDGTIIDILLNGKSRIPDVQWTWRFNDNREDKCWCEDGTGNPVLQEGDLNEITHWMTRPAPPVYPDNTQSDLRQADDTQIKDGESGWVSIQTTVWRNNKPWVPSAIEYSPKMTAPEWDGVPFIEVLLAKWLADFKQAVEKRPVAADSREAALTATEPLRVSKEAFDEWLTDRMNECARAGLEGGDMREQLVEEITERFDLLEKKGGV